MTKYVLGLDIGTTTISWSVIDAVSLKQIEVSNRLNDSVIGDAVQNPDRILDICREIIDGVKKRFAHVSAIGITGQMHGVIIIDRNGNAVSPLYTWQYKAPQELCREITSITGYKAYSGYGIVTIYSLVKQNGISAEGVSFCSIMDYVAMKLCRSTSPVIHSSIASSFGLYDLNSNGFDMEACRKIGLDCSMLPKVSATSVPIGSFEDSIVFIPIGDNQASFLGVVADDSDTICINCGTGSQISVSVEDWHGHTCQEVRPFVDGKFLLTGSALCGGRAYSVLESFFRRFATAAGLEDKPLYELMNNLVVYSEGNGLSVDTRFCGTRDNPEITGGIGNITEKNFTPENLIFGFLSGMAQELFDFYSEMKLSGIFRVVGSGNAIRKNPTFVRILSEKFGMNIELSNVCEEAAAGACFFVARHCNNWR